ncbi:MAG: hypothetical protein ACLRL6_01530 [Clostridium sp.]
MDKALIVIDIQNDITKNYKEIIDNINSAIDWAVAHEIRLFIYGMRIYHREQEPLSPIRVVLNWPVI